MLKVMSNARILRSRSCRRAGPTYFLIDLSKSQLESRPGTMRIASDWSVLFLLSTATLVRSTYVVYIQMMI